MTFLCSGASMVFEQIHFGWHYSPATGQLMISKQLRLASNQAAQIAVCLTLAFSMNVPSARAVVVLYDGFGDADRNNDGAITAYDTDLNDSGIFNDPVADA